MERDLFHMMHALSVQILEKNETAQRIMNIAFSIRCFHSAWPTLEPSPKASKCYFPVT